ncbi:hypothetical protein HOP50_04g30830 [Chloropicon primus]|uniref:Uncharacterized protein n=1 Tax=Chloropicon primus TaxID=1764295 RepID=A0A5B8MJB6_9CHLO|nr:hypothetical protein A3770_04p30810 [Chloropicon primus]UPQ99774.1 hypothetical protein HOP50_04g30830 [Chloropicon primus]|eukprot:QDZ20563.1 hypothetical protein A3770_04p30810 [Chloropicon primus]
MNLFYLDEDEEQCAKAHCNKHVPKMVVETAQLLCNVHHRMEEPLESIPYKYTRSAGPSLAPMRWLMTSLDNYRWACRMGLHLSEEYTNRFGGKTHKTQAVLEWLKVNEPRGLQDIGITTPLCAMPEEYKIENDPIASYRQYYVYDKHRFAAWPEGMTPRWFSKGVEELKRKGLYNNVEIAYPTKNQKQRIVAKRVKRRNLNTEEKPRGVLKRGAEAVRTTPTRASGKRIKPL